MLFALFFNFTLAPKRGIMDLSLLYTITKCEGWNRPVCFAWEGTVVRTKRAGRGVAPGNGKRGALIVYGEQQGWKR